MLTLSKCFPLVQALNRAEEDLSVFFRIEMSLNLTLPLVVPPPLRFRPTDRTSKLSFPILTSPIGVAVGLTVGLAIVRPVPGAPLGPRGPRSPSMPCGPVGPSWFQVIADSSVTQDDTSRFPDVSDGSITRSVPYGFEPSILE